MQLLPPAAPEVIPRWGQQHQRDRRGATGLDESERFEQFIQGAETPGHHHQGIALTQEEQFPREEITEVEQSPFAAAHEWVRMLLEGEINIQADAVTATGAAVRRLHDAAPCTGHHLEAGLNSQTGHLFGQLVAGVVNGGAGGTEDRDLSGPPAGVEHRQGLADVGQTAADQPPLIVFALVTGDLQKRNNGALNQASLRMIPDLLGEGLKRTADRRRGGGGGWGQRYLEMVPERVVLGTAPTTVSTFCPPLKTIRVGMLRMPY